MTWAAIPITAITDRSIPRSALCVLAYLSWRQGNKKTSWPSVERIADDLQLDIRTVKRALRILEYKGLISRTYPDRQGRGLKVEYSVILKGGITTTLSGKKGGTGVQERVAFPSQLEGCIRNNYNKEHTTKGADCFLNDFDQARKLYPGVKRGCDTEFADFKKKYRDWKEVLPLLVPAIENQIQCRADKEESGAWVPNWKNFRTWLNQRCWEIEESGDQSTENVRGTHDATEEDIAKLQAAGVFDD
jgi:DNA-binding transcriptional ArsR family regulator